MTPPSPLRMVIAEIRDIVRHGLRLVLSASEQVHQLEAIRPAIGQPAEEIEKAALSALLRFTGGSPPQDDTTLVVLAHRR